MVQNRELNLPKIGYLFHYPRIDHPKDKFRLDIHIASEPTNQHFDVLRVTLPIETKTGNKMEKITHPWHFETEARVSAGVLVMEDRKGKKEEAFTFGGRLTIEKKDEQTMCILVSSAPILDISGATSTHMLFIEEVEILLAESQVKYPDREAFEKQLNKIDPLGLYLACLEALLEKYENFPQKIETQYQLLLYLHSEKHRLEAAGLTRDPTPHLEDLF